MADFMALDDAGKMVRERKVPIEPDDIPSPDAGRRRLRSGRGRAAVAVPGDGLIETGLPVICVETCHMKAPLQAQQINKPTATPRPE
jgi:transposase